MKEATLYRPDRGADQCAGRDCKLMNTDDDSADDPGALQVRAELERSIAVHFGHRRNCLPFSYHRRACAHAGPSSVAASPCVLEEDA